MANESPLFLRLRTIAFSFVNFISFVWVILYSIVIFLQWDLMAGSERSLVAVMLIANVITFVTLLVLLLLKFRVWLDVARICFLLFAQLGTASAFAFWKPQFRCQEKLGDQQGICDVISLYILITSWVVPALLLSYLGGLAIWLYRHRSKQPITGSPTLDATGEYPVFKEGTHSARPSLLPIMTKLTTPVSPAFPPESHSRPRHSVNTSRSMASTWSKYSSPPATPKSSVGNPARLSKRSPIADLV